MIVFPSQKLTTGELCVSIAVGLMLFLLPNDAKNYVNNASLAEGLVFINTFIITVVLIFFIKRFEAVGTAMLSTSVFSLVSFIITAFNGIVTKGSEYWPSLSEYQLITMFILWTLPFFCAVFVRLLLSGRFDNNDARKGFTRFLSLSLRALMIIYSLVIVFVQIVPVCPNMAGDRTVDLVLSHRIISCLNHTHENGTLYLWWHSLILAPLTFSLLILNPKIKWWHMLIITVSVGVTLEIFQFSLNTGTACVDDVMLYIIGGSCGMLLKYFLDLLRNVITMGEDKNMLSFSYNHIKRKSLSPVKVLTEE